MASSLGTTTATASRRHDVRKASSAASTKPTTTTEYACEAQGTSRHRGLATALRRRLRQRPATLVRCSLTELDHLLAIAELQLSHLAAAQQSVSRGLLVHLVFSISVTEGPGLLADDDPHGWRACGLRIEQTPRRLCMKQINLGPTRLQLWSLRC